MNIRFTRDGWEDYVHWQGADPDVAARINELIGEIMRSPFKGTGKLEPLKYDLKGYWSRRITGEHRLVYRVDGTTGVDQTCTVIQCRFHYGD